jgi:integrase
MRPLTLPELLQRDGGRLLFFHLQEQFEDLGLGAVGNDKLAALRKFTRFIVKTALLPSGTNLRKRWGPVLVSPIEDREIEKRTVRSKVDVPPLDLMPFVYEATCDWEEQPRRRSLSAPTIGCLTRTAFDSGARGVELRNATLAAQSFNRGAGVYALPGWLLLQNGKIGGTRRARLDEYGEAQLKDYLANSRPLISDDPLGFFFPNERGGQLSKASLSSATKPLLDYLKSKGLVCSTFTFHATRKTFATQFIERGGSIKELTEQCGWKNTAQLAVYLCESRRMRQSQEEQWLRTCEPWRAA